LPVVHDAQEKPKAPEVKIDFGFDINDNSSTDDDPNILALDDLDDSDPLGYNDDPDVDDGDTFKKSAPPVSLNAEYCGGELALQKFLIENLEYPEIPRTNGVSGVVHIQFVVGKNGKVRDARVMRPLDPWLDGEALRVAKLLDCFTPAMQGGLPVDVYFNLPIRFVLSR